MTYGGHYQVQRYTHGIDQISMDFWMLEDHDNGWIPDGSEMNLSGERQRLYYLHDELESVTKVIGENGKTSAHYNYDEFGVPKPSVKFDQNWPGPDNTFGYTGYQYDVSAGLWYAQARYYMPEIGRFISEGPWSGTITTPTTMNPYPYVLNNPLKYVDPLGLSAQQVGNYGTGDLSKYTNNGSDAFYGKLKGPTLMEAAEIAHHIYFEKLPEYAKEDMLLGGWKMVDIYQVDSLRIGIYARKGSDGMMEYVLANKGTMPPQWGRWGEQWDHWEDNLKQPFGKSQDMFNSIEFARDFVEKNPNAHITFVRHSKGGAEAAANALATTKNAILFNPATLFPDDYGLKISAYTASMTAYIVDGDILNNVFGDISRPIDKMVYLPRQSLLNPIENHSMDAVKKAIKQWERRK